MESEKYGAPVRSIKFAITAAFVLRVQVCMAKKSYKSSFVKLIEQNVFEQ